MQRRESVNIMVWIIKGKAATEREIGRVSLLLKMTENFIGLILTPSFVKYIGPILALTHSSQSE